MKTYFSVKIKPTLGAYWRTILFLLMTVTFTQSARAVGVNINVGVTVQAATCDVSNKDDSDVIMVDFETITKKGIESGEYKAPILFKIVCSNDTPSLTLTLLGDATNFDNSLLKSTDNENLGFEFQLNNQKFGLGTTSSNFTTKTIPTLAVLPKLNAKAITLTAGSFNSASAKLVLEYK